MERQRPRFAPGPLSSSTRPCAILHGMGTKRDTVAISFWLKPEELFVLDAAAAQLGVRRSELMRLAIRQFIIDQGLQTQEGET